MERGYRPPSYSDSFLRSPSSFQLEMAANLVASHSPGLPSPPPEPPSPPPPVAKPFSTWYTNSLKFSFHIFLISIFETAFYFGYVSQYEDTAILNLTNTYIVELGQTCLNLTTGEQIYLNTLLENFLNSTQILHQASLATQARMSANDLLLRYAVLYVSSLFTLFGCLTIVAWFFGKPVKWREIFQENAIVLIFLSLYEYLFFRTIVIQYSLTSAPEINGSLVRELQTECGLLSGI